MNTVSDQNYLKSQQYRNGNNLDARIQLHFRFSTNPTNFHEWMFDQINLQPAMKVMEIGCGTGAFWKTNIQRLPANLQSVLLDLSSGMVSAARSSFNRDERFTFGAADAQNLPFGDCQFDVALANHMLYHVPNISQAVKELRRVLSQGGRLCASTNGTGHLRELRDMMRRFGLDDSAVPGSFARYGLDNAAEVLGEYFSHVKVLPFVDNLFVTETQPLMDYIHSMIGIWNVPDDAESAMDKWITAEIAAKGGFTIQKVGGVVLAW